VRLRRRPAVGKPCEERRHGWRHVEARARRPQPGLP